MITHSLRLVGTEQPGVVSLLHHDVGDAGLVVLLQLDAGIANSQQLIVEDLNRESKLAVF